MGKTFSTKADAVLSSGIWLSEYGINNWALTREQALKALDELKSAKIGILGGDVYKSEKNRIILTHDNWFIDFNEQPDFLEKSIDKARDYVKNYKAGGHVWFSFVPHGD